MKKSDLARERVPYAEETETPESKTRRKKELHALQALGEDLISLQPTELEGIPLNERLREAITEARRLQGHSRYRIALKRQRQFIGRLMREISDVEPIRTAVTHLQAGQQASTDAFHQVENWRDQVISEGEAAIIRLTQRYPQISAGQVRGLLNEIQTPTPAKRKAALRKLFRYLRAHISEDSTL